MWKIVLAALASLAFVAVPAPALASKGDDNRLMLQAQTGVGNIPKAKATFESRRQGNSLENRLKVQVERFRPGTTHPVLLNGRVIGKITANQFGRAEINWRTRSDDRGNLGAPPPVKRGDRIQVGKLVGTFR